MSGSRDNLIIDVDYIDNVVNIVTQIIFHHATQNIEGNICLNMTHVRYIVHSQAAAVPLNVNAAVGRALTVRIYLIKSRYVRERPVGVRDITLIVSSINIRVAQRTMLNFQMVQMDQ